VKIVLDTNILLVSISRYSQFHWIFEAIIEGKINLCISTEILFEYEEIIGKYLGIETAKFTIKTILNLPSTEFISQYFRWNLIQTDKDDNKFVDCAIASNAEYIVSNDKHFQILKSLKFPKLNVVSLQEFENIYSK
jgi:putative PIN family toxin of toxin-antitoxin system